MRLKFQEYFFSFVFLNSIFIGAEAACPAPGTGIVVNGATATENGCTITTAGSSGLQSNLAGTINFSNGSVTTTGGGAYGAYANGTGSLINLNNISFLTASANALFLNSGQISFNTGSITTTGASTNGAQLLGTNALLTLDNVNIQTDGTAGVGLFIQLGDNTVNATNCTITTTANGGRGVDVGLGAGVASSASLSNCIINTSQGIGPPSFGAVVSRNGSSVSIQDSTINSEVYGVHAINGGASITVDNSQININATAAVFGAYAQNNTTITLQNNTRVTTTGGNNAHGFVIQDGSTGNLFDSSLETFGTNAQGIFMIGFNANNQANLSNSTVTTNGTGGSAITSFANSGITNALQATSTIFSSVNEDLISIAGGIANIDFTNVSALASPTHRLLLVDGSNPATLNWVADSSNLSGDMQVIAGNIGNVTLNNATTWTGAALDVTNLTVNNSDWNLTANSTITNQLINNGLIDFVSAGNAFKTLTVGGPYIGQNGTIGLNTFLGADGSPSDLLIINGGSATGLTSLNIKNTTGGGALTTANGILVVDAINGGTTTLDAFSLSNDVISGPYEYTLFRGSVDASGEDNWYLRSTIILPPNPPLPPSPDPNYRQEVSLYAALPSLTLLYQRTLLDTLHQRVGEEEQLKQSCQSRDYFNGFWARVINEGGNQRGGNIFHDGPNFDYHFFAVQAGIDVYRKEYSDGSRDHLGILGAIGRGHGKVRHFTNITAGHNKFNAYTGGLYATHFGPSGWYLDGLLELSCYNHMKADSTRNIPHLKTHGSGVAASLESGYPFKFKSFIIEPQAQLVYQRIRLHDSHDIAAKVDFKNTDSTAGRLGVRFASTWNFGQLDVNQPRQLTVWLRTSVWNDFQGKSKTSFSSDEGPIDFASKLGGPWFQGDLGLTAQVTDAFYFYGTFGGNVYLNGRGQAYNAVAGMRANF